MRRRSAIPPHGVMSLTTGQAADGGVDERVGRLIAQRRVSDHQAIQRRTDDEVERRVRVDVGA